ncbi:MAG: DUF3108 domain-containing protein [Magnetococcales bacterium]|nr:DUF3108 domain-containing protein [Magnetococcales bacterium]NGZ06988.1 DUF3108 domain-containing protein [Magnetococcales bacterium]
MGALPVWAGVQPLGAVAGERLRYNIHWMGVPAGFAYMEMRPAKKGEYTFEAGVESIGMVKLLYSVKDRLHAEGGMTSSGGMVARYYAKHQQRGAQKRLIEYRFDREWGEAFRTQEGEEPITIGGVTPTVHDMLTGFHALRGCAGLVAGKSLYIPMVDGKKVYQVEASVGQPDRLNTPLGWFDVFPLTIMVGNSDLFRLQGSIVVWLTGDARRLPVKVESRFELKSVSADLIAYDDGRGEQREVKETK